MSNRTNRLTLSLLAACSAFATGAFADTVHWTNPAGGNFEDNGNWDRGSPPGAGDTALFDLPATYTVLFTQNGTKGALTFTDGDVTLNTVGYSSTVQGMTIGPAATPVGCKVHFLGGTNTTAGVSVKNGATLDLQGANINGGASFLDFSAGSTLLMNGGTLYMNSCYVAGSSITISGGGFLTVNSLSTSTASTFVVTGTNSRIAGDGVSLRGTLSILSGGKVSSPQSAITLAACTTLVSGTGSIIPNQIVADAASHVTVELGGSVGGGNYHGPVTLHPQGSIAWSSNFYSPVVVDAGATIPGGTMHSTLEIDQNSLGTPTIDGLSGGVIIHLDGLSTRTAPFFSAYPGTNIEVPLSVDIRNANALHLGRTIPLVQYTSSPGTPNSHNHFSSLTAPALGGGRALALAQTGNPVHVSLNIVPGGDPCWSSDFDGDGDSGTDADIEAFFACLGGNCCATCATADFNSDGDTGTDADIEAFFRVLGGGPC